MISSDRNIDTAVQLIEAIWKWLGVRAELLKVDAADKGVRILAALVFIVLFLFLSFMVSLLLAMAIAIAISVYTGLAWAFVIMAVAYLILFLLLIILKRNWVVNPLVRLFARILNNQQF